MSEIDYRLKNDCTRICSDGSIWTRRTESSEWKRKVTTLKNGRPTVVLEWDGIRKRHHVADLVLEAFIGPRPTRKKAVHANGRKTDCRLENLSWGQRQRKGDLDEEMEFDLAWMGEDGIQRVLDLYWHYKADKISIANEMELEYRTVQHVIDTHPRKMSCA